MKAKKLIWMLLSLLLGIGAFQLSAQQSEPDRKRFEEIKAKAEKGSADAQCKLGTYCRTGGRA